MLPVVTICSEVATVFEVTVWRNQRLTNFQIPAWDCNPFSAVITANGSQPPRMKAG
jgi:hypothetical protein